MAHKEKPRFIIHTLGCKVNQYDSEKMRSRLQRQGYHPVKLSDERPADLIIVNTCSVTAESDRKGRQMIRKLIRRHPEAQVMVTGCYAERFPERIQSIEGVDSIVPIQDQEAWLEEMTRDIGWGCEDQDAFWSEGEGIDTFFEHTRAFLKIQDGCDLKCTYCSIPLSRGPARSRRIEDVVPEAEGLARHGYPEVVLCGICLGNFGLDTGETLADLLRRLAEIEGLKRVRISSFEPQNLTDDLFQAMAEHGDIICPHLHLPLQSGSNAVLHRMKRPYTYDYFAERVQKAKEIMPHFEVTTDLMVGFPGETEEDLQASLSAIRQCRFTKVHSFRFSAREGTPAERLPGRLPGKEVEERRKQVDALADQTALAAKQRYVGKSMPVLLETQEAGRWIGLTPNYIRAEVIPETDLCKGMLVPVQFDRLENGHLVGRVQ